MTTKTHTIAEKGQTWKNKTTKDEVIVFGKDNKNVFVAKVGSSSESVIGLEEFYETYDFVKVA